MIPAGQSGLQPERAGVLISSHPAGEPRYALLHTAAPHTLTGNEAVGWTPGGAWEEERRK